MTLVQNLYDINNKEYRLGDIIEDRITSFKGVFVGITQWNNFCVRIGIQTKELKDNKPIETQWFDDADIKLVRKSNVGPRPSQMMREEQAVYAGGPKRQEESK